MKKIAKGLAALDAFGQPISLNIDGKTNYKSAFGGIITAGAIALMIFAFQKQIQSFFDRIYLTVSIQQQFIQNPPLINLDQSNFIFALAIDQPSEYPFSSSPFFTVEVAQHYNNQTNKSKITIPVALRQCNLKDFHLFSSSNDLLEIYNDFNFNNYLCPEDSFKFDLKGAFLFEDFQFVTIKVLPCQKSKAATCPHKEIIDEYIKAQGSLRLSIYTSNNVVNPQKSTNYSQIYLSEDLSFKFQPGLMQQSINVFFKNYVVETDNSLLPTEDTVSENFVYREKDQAVIQSNINLKSLLEDKISTTLNEGDPSPLTIYLRSDSVRSIASRKFQKLDELLAYFGGLFQLFTIVFGFIVGFYNQNNFRLWLANRLYHFDQQTQDGQVMRRLRDKKYDKIQKLIEMDLHRNDVMLKGANEQEESLGKINHLLHTHENNPQSPDDVKLLKEVGFSNRSEFLIWFFEEILTTRQKIKSSVSYYLHILSCKKFFANPQNKLIDLTLRYIEKDLNVKHMINQINNIDKLKQMLLDQPQKILFNFSPKPYINHRHIDRIRFSKKRHTQISGLGKHHKQATSMDYESFHQLMLAYEKIVTTRSTDETTNQINNKLVHLLGNEIRVVFRQSLILEQEQRQRESYLVLEQGGIEAIVVDEEDRHQQVEHAELQQEEHVQQ